MKKVTEEMRRGDKGGRWSRKDCAVDEECRSRRISQQSLGMEIESKTTMDNLKKKYLERSKLINREKLRGASDKDAKYSA